MKSTTYYIFAGVNGVGKSSLYHTDKKEYGVRINPDEILYKNNKDWRDEKDQMEVARETVKLRRECLINGVSFNQETTFSTQGNIAFIKKAKSLGYRIELYFIGVSEVAIAKERVAMRVEKGGHGISIELIEKRYLNSFNILKQVIKEELCDKISIYDNSGSYIIKIFERKDNRQIMINEIPKWLYTILEDTGYLETDNR